MRYVPTAYMQYCIERVINDSRLALWLEPGLGKTGISLTAVNDLKYNRLAISKTLVVAPKKVAEATWQKEGRKWDHLKHLRFSTVLGSIQQRVRALNTPADVYVINRDNVKWLVEYYRNAWPFDLVILDESTSFKSHDSQRFKAMKLVAPKTKRVIELTGTPSPQGLIDLWAQIYLLDQGERLGKTIGGYRERYFNPDQRNQTTIFSYKPKDDSKNAIYAKLADLCISMKTKDWLELPELIMDEIPVMLDEPSRKKYKQLERETLLELPDGVIDAGTAAVLTNKLLQLCNGAVYDGDKKALEIHDCKIEAFMELVEQLQGQSALVFYNFKHDRDRILQALAKSDLRVRVYQGPQEETDWNAGEIDILLAHPASCAYGLNLQDGGHHIVWFGLNYSLELYDQGNKRLHRQGQQHSVIIHHLVVQGGIDEDVMAALQRKGDTQEALMQALKARIVEAKQHDRPK